MRGILFGKWILVAALGVAYGTVGLGCGHEHHDDYEHAAYNEPGYYQHRDNDDHGHDVHYYHDYDRDRY
ncbi:MAG TPA: hypothetical protein VGI81_09115 [Tepidisphaeraceae bacterium]